MKISTRCRYATLALFDIAFMNDGNPTQVRQIAKRQGIPLRFLEQIFQDLKRAELVDGKRGRNGGYFLSRPPRDITIKDIIEATEGPMDKRVESSTTPPTSTPGTADARNLHDALWREIAVRIYGIYGDYSLEDLVVRAEEAGLSRGAPGYMYFI